MAAPEPALEATPPQSVHIVVLVDATGSMGSFCSSVGSTLQQLFAVLDVLFEGTAHVRLVAYEDYCDGQRLLRTCAGQRAELKDFAAKLRAGGGGDTPEAVKTALNRIVEDLRAMNAAEPGASGRTVVIHYTDAPPHHPSKVGSDSKNLQAEIKALEGKSPGFDWVEIVRAFRKLGTPVVTFLPPSHANSVVSHCMALLGETVLLPDTQSKTITEFTIGFLLQTMAQPFKEILCHRYTQEPDVASLQDEQSDQFSASLQADMNLVPHTFKAHPAFARDLRRLATSFRDSSSFQDMVFRALAELLVGDSALALTYNSVLGVLWRLVCKRREDPRVQPLCDALSNCCQKLAGPDQTQLRTWIDESYNQMDEIRALIRSVPDPLSAGVLVLDVKGEEMPSKEEMRSIMHAPLPGVLRKVQGLLSRLLVVTSGALPANEEDDAPMYLPLALSDKDLLMTITHLLLPGMMLSLRPAAMVAILAHLGRNAVLQPRAERFLKAWRGQWIPPIEKAEEYPEILNAEFVRLVSRVPEFLTDAERELYSHLNLIIRVRRAAPMRLHVKTGYTPSIKALTPDFKSLCKCCGQKRSFTLVVGDTCGLCLSDADGAVTAQPAPEVANPWKRDCPEPSEDCSHLVECRTCFALYAVVNTDCLNVSPKCHYCRSRLPPETVTCGCCSNRFCKPGASGQSEPFTCAVCARDAAAGLQEQEVPFSQLAELNSAVFPCLGLGEAARPLVFDRVGLFKLWMGHSEALAAVVAAERPKELLWAGKPVKDVAEVLEELVEGVTRGRLSETCSLCFEDRALPALQSACGHCPTMACAGCLRRWYGALAPGRLYVPSEGLCPFCKRTPKAATMRSFNRPACRLSGRRTLELRADTYYGWCRTCFRIAEAAPRECAQEAPVLERFECEACHLARLAQDEEALAQASRKCPGCQAPTVKVLGCNHITCPCGVHWCWQCGGAFGECEIYIHMEDAHGTIGLDDYGDYDD